MRFGEDLPMIFCNINSATPSLPSLHACRLREENDAIKSKKCGTKTSDITTHRLHATGVIEDYSPSFSLLELSALRDLHIFEILFVLERIHQLRLSCGGVDEDDATFAAHASTLAATSVRPISD